MFEEAKFRDWSKLLFASHEYSDRPCKVVTTLDELDDTSQRPVATSGILFADKYDVVDAKFRLLMRPFLAKLKCWQILSNPAFPKDVGEVLSLSPPSTRVLIVGRESLVVVRVFSEM